MAPDMTSEGCGDVPRVEIPSEYTPKGVQRTTPNGLNYYEVVPASGVSRSDFAVIQYYDVLGPESDATRQQADRISAGLSCKVVCPDFFMTGTGYPGMLGAGHRRETMWEWFERVAPFDKVVERTADIKNVLKTEGITRFAGIGHCWGAITGVGFSKLPSYFIGFGLLHGRALTPEDCAASQIPLANFPSSMEGDQPHFFPSLPEGYIRDKSAYRFFYDVPHGWSSGRGDWGNPLKRKRAQEVIEDYVRYVEAIIEAPSP